jgi:hypothetical protein
MVYPNERTADLHRQFQDNYDLVVALLDTEMRYDEMAKLPWTSVDLNPGFIRIYHNKVDSAVTMSLKYQNRSAIELWKTKLRDQPILKFLKSNHKAIRQECSA